MSKNSANLFNNLIAGGNEDSAVGNISRSSTYSVRMESTVAGTMNLQGAMGLTTDANGEPTDWETVDSQAGTTGHLWSVTGAGYPYVRVQWLGAAATLNARLLHKEN